MPKKEKNTFSHFFKEDAEYIKDIINPGTDKQMFNEVGFVKKEEFPIINNSGALSEDEFKVQWQKLRSFFRNGHNDQGLPADLWPVIMSPLYTKSMVAADFPVWVSDEYFEGEATSCLSLKDILTHALNKIGQGEDKLLILKKNIEGILYIANKHLADKKPQLFQPAINKVLDELEKQLEVSGEDAQVFTNDIQQFKQALPPNGVLLPYSINISFQLLEAAIAVTLNPKRKNLKQEISSLKSKLKDLLSIEREKGPEKKNPDKLKDSLSFVHNMMKFDELSSILPEAGSESMGKERVQRITEVLVDLEKAGTIFDQSGFIFIDELLYNNINIDWKNLFENANVKVFQKVLNYEALSSTFEQQLGIYSKLFMAKRIGGLELEDKYQADIHDEYFQHFSWQRFSTDELNSCPPFILIVDDVRLFDVEFNKLSKMLSANIPVKIVAVKRDHFVDHNQNGLGKEERRLHSQAELGALMLSNKNIYVVQSTSISPSYLFDGFKAGLSAFAPAFFYILNIDETTHENPFIWTSSAIESRDFPNFTFKGLLGTPWGSRFEVDNNPQPALPWPVHQLKVMDENRDKKEMAFPFTFADQAVLNPVYHHYYYPVDRSLWNEKLISLTEYMSRSAEDNIDKVPFIWMIDKANELHKVAVSWPMVIATQERQDFWRFLQENSGINNYHVTLAVEQAKAEMQAVHSFEIDQLKRENEIEIEKIRKEEGMKVMENLTSVLLGLDITTLDTGSIPASSSSLSNPTVIKSDETVVEDTPKGIAEEESVLSNDPYIDTALCTSCNECTDLNRAMFKYNADKMAYIADAKAGTFRQLVEAAELCPVGIIHPGSPLNPNEPDLDNLVKRAEKFN